MVKGLPWPQVAKIKLELAVDMNNVLSKFVRIIIIDFPKNNTALKTYTKGQHKHM